MIRHVTHWALLVLCLPTSTVCYAQDADAVALLHDSGLLQALLAILPPSVAAWIIGAAFALVPLSAILLATKQALIKFWRPADEWPRWLVYTLTALDWLTIASASVRGLAKNHAALKELRQLKSVRPGPIDDGVFFVEDDAEAKARRGHRTPFAMLFALMLSVGALSNQGCAGTESRTRTALSAFGAVVEPASRAAHDGCLAAGALIVAEAHAGQIVEGVAREKLDAAHARCDRIAEALATVRALYDQAVSAVEAGAFDVAEGFLTQLRGAWARVGEVSK